jgi:hypothetical protein
VKQYLKPIHSGEVVASSTLNPRPETNPFLETRCRRRSEDANPKIRRLTEVPLLGSDRQELKRKGRAPEKEKVM